MQRPRIHGPCPVTLSQWYLTSRLFDNIERVQTWNLAVKVFVNNAMRDTLVTKTLFMILLNIFRIDNGKPGRDPMTLIRNGRMFLRTLSLMVSSDTFKTLKYLSLIALLSLPPMGRRKFSIQGRPHGRNELIAEYLWIAYCCSLAPDQPRDENMKRTRKQVSSHIQVLKSFLRDHPASKLFLP